MSKPDSSRAGARWALLLFGVVLALIGLVLAAGGVRLIALGGSWYYLLAGVGLVVSGVLFARGRVAGAWLYGVVFFGTVAWALWEVGPNFWPLVPRLSAVLVLAVFALLLLPQLTRGRSRKPAYTLAGLLVLALLAGGAEMFVPHGVIEAGATPTPAATAAPSPADAGSRWSHYGRTPAGTRFAPYEQITRDNVGKLQVAWTFRTGDIAGKGSEDQSTPLQIGDTLYVCTSHNQVFALNAETGEERWKFDPKAPDTKVWNRCRGVGYYEPGASASASAAVATSAGTPAPAPAPAVPAAACAQRIVLSTVDARLIELDARTGQPCESFGNKGTVDLKVGLGEVKPNYYMPTSAPTVVRNLIVIGGWVYDGRSTDEPSGVVRAFNATTGELAWAWDLGNPAITKLPPEGQTYTRTTPNVWSTPSFDDKLGLIYLPTGNQTPDYWGAQRSKESEKYSSSVVALDIDTGRVRWAFQTVHHDLWDYDVPSQPALYDIPDGKGGVTPALVQLTKRGQIFVLDRRNGKPLADVQEKPVPQGGQAGDWTSPTQPYSVGMPSIGTTPLSEAAMWGATPFDQLWCRIEFRKMRYDGEFTPPTTQRSLQYPGNYGGFNWGSASINEAIGYLIVNDIRMPQWFQMISRAETDKPGAAASHDGLHPQEGTPYGVTKNSFMSPLGVPCHAPPYGTMTAIDLQTRQIAWQRPISTLQDTGPLGIKTGLQIPIGMPTMGGPLSTSTGLVFFAGTQDYYLRALDARTGHEIWKGRLPVGGQATPMSYISPESGRQFVAIVAGGARQSPDRGDYVIAYALPKQQ